MTNQEAFTTMVQHLRKQGCKSQDEQHQTCLYRGPNGLKCAVGALIPDEEYREEWDEKGYQVNKLHCASLHGLDPSMLRTMQTIHDQVSVGRWEEEFNSVAFIFGLRLPPLEASHA